MSNKKTIVEIFQETDFSVKPASQAWDKLERKLDVATSLKKPGLVARLTMRRLLAAAALAVLLTSAAVTAWYATEKHQSAVFASTESLSFSVEDFAFDPNDPDHLEELRILRLCRQRFAALNPGGI